MFKFSLRASSSIKLKKDASRKHWDLATWDLVLAWQHYAFTFIAFKAGYPGHCGTYSLFFKNKIEPKKILRDHDFKSCSTLPYFNLTRLNREVNISSLRVEHVH